MIFKMSRGYLFSVILPLGLAAGYYMFIAADRYVSESIVTVSKANDTSGELSGLAMLAGVGTSSKQDTLYLREYIYSFDMIKNLDQKIGLRKAYESQTRDPFYRLYTWMPQELYQWYFTNRVHVVYDDLTGLLKIQTQGFTPEQAQMIASAILNESENFVNELSHKISRQQLAFAEEELRKAKERYSNAKNHLMAFQNRYGMFDPIAQAQAKATLSTEFDAALARKETELHTMLSYLQESAPQVVALKNEIDALRVQTQKESSQVASETGKPINALASQYQNLVIEVGFAEDAYKLALAAVEKSRIDANQKIKYLAVVQTPPLPQMAEYPQKLYNLATLLIVLSILYGLFHLIKATIEDHKY